MGIDQGKRVHGMLHGCLFIHISENRIANLGPFPLLVFIFSDLFSKGIFQH